MKYKWYNPKTYESFSLRDTIYIPRPDGFDELPPMLVKPEVWWNNELGGYLTTASSGCSGLDCNECLFLRLLTFGECKVLTRDAACTKLSPQEYAEIYLTKALLV